jgi:putative heme iron utilization protein
LHDTTGHGEGGLGALAAEARDLIGGATRGVLSTLGPDGGFPHASIVDLAPVDGGDVITLLSALAVHRKYVEADDRASILIAPFLGDDDAMMRPRVTLVGHLALEPDREVYRDAYLAAHPEAEMYLKLPDFAFFRLRTERARYIAGFGRMGWLDGVELRAGDAV